MPLKTGTCDTCSVEKVKLRNNPFTHKEQCEDCRKASIIGITDVKSRYKLKNADLKGLKTVTEPQPAFLGGPDRRWYLADEVEKRAEELEKKEEAKKSTEVTKSNKRKKDEEVEQEEGNVEAEPPVKRGRGRPKKAITKTPVVEGDAKPKRGRGRPRKVQKEEE